MGRPLRRCTECPELTTGTRCEAHRLQGRRQERRFQQGATNYNRPRWMRLRDRFRMTHPFCINNGTDARCTLLTDVVDHRIPHEGDETLMYDEANLQPMCWSCHSRKTAREVHAR